MSECVCVRGVKAKVCCYRNDEKDEEKRGRGKTEKGADDDVEKMSYKIGREKRRREEAATTTSAAAAAAAALALMRIMIIMAAQALRERGAFIRKELKFF